MSATTPLLELVAVSRVFAGSPPVVALRTVDLRIEAGEYLSIVGPSGSGKSTMLNLLGLMDRPSGGEYLFEGTAMSAQTEDARSAVRASSIGFVFQSFHLLSRRTALENVLLAMLYTDLPRHRREARAREALERVGLAHRLDFLPGTLSGGERQRVALARAIVCSPRLLLADEPTGNLDQERSGEVIELCESLVADGVTLVVITHDPEVAGRAPRTLHLHDGQVREW